MKFQGSFHIYLIILLDFCLLLYPVACCKAVQVALNEGIQRAVHNAVDVGGFAAGAGILDQRVRHKDVVADLAAPFDL